MNAFGFGDAARRTPADRGAAGEHRARPAGCGVLEGPAVLDRADAEVDEVRRAGVLEHREDQHRVGHDDAEPDSDQDRDHDQSEGVAEDARQGDGAAVRTARGRPRTGRWAPG